MKKIFISLLCFATTLMVPTTISAQTSSPFLIVDAEHDGFYYAFAPSIIYDNGMYHVFFCSNSLGETGAYDFMRHTTSIDGVHWTSPTIVLRATPRDNYDYSACDPSIVYYQGYYYLYYTDVYRPATGLDQDIIAVARSQNINGPYAIFTQNGTWVENGLPKAIIFPLVKRTAQPAGLGALQQAVIAKDGKLIMWYNDDSVAYKNDPVGYNYGYLQTYKLESTDPVSWQPSTQNATDLPLGSGHSMDIKYDSVNQQYVIEQIINPHTASSSLVVRFSQDGIHWDNYRELADATHFPDFAHNAGILSDKSGTLFSDRILIGFGAPYNLTSTDVSFGRWNLFGVWVSLTGQSAPSLLSSPGFEPDGPMLWIANTTNWAITDGASHTGRHSSKIQNSTDALIYQDVSGLDPSKKYTVSVWAKTDTGITTAKAAVWLHDTTEHGIVGSSDGILNETWQKISVIYTPTSNGKLRIHLIYRGSGSPVYFDDVEVDEVDTPLPKPGDLNNDSKVDSTDYQLFVANFGKSGLNVLGDIDNNDKVDIFDYNKLVEGFGK